ncbi:MAG: hypothetical protein JNK25_15005 [Phycisphaerae bacterium]|nr:hypothetical protein [Phycisphaerae bacterium]
MPIAAVMGLLHTVHAADEVTVTFRWAVTATNGVDTLDAPVFHTNHDAGAVQVHSRGSSRRDTPGTPCPNHLHPFEPVKESELSWNCWQDRAHGNA